MPTGPFFFLQSKVHRQFACSVHIPDITVYIPDITVLVPDITMCEIRQIKAITSKLPWGPSTEERRKVQWAWGRIAKQKREEYQVLSKVAIWKQSNALRSMACIWATQYYLNSQKTEDWVHAQLPLSANWDKQNHPMSRKMNKNFSSGPNWALNGPFNGQQILS